MVSALDEPSLDMSFFIPPLAMPSFFIPSSLMPVVVSVFIEPLFIELPVVPLVMPGLVMLSCWAAGPVPCANAEPHMRVRAVAIRIFFIAISIELHDDTTRHRNSERSYRMQGIFRSRIET
jgi:hypothetical protein